MAVLKVIRGMTPGQILPLDSLVSILGRHPLCHVVLDAPAVSRQHARILQIDDGYFIEDLESRNGTFVNGEMVKQRRRLAENDEIQICDLAFTFHHGNGGPKDENSMTVVVIDDGDATATEEPMEVESAIMSKLDVSSGVTAGLLEVNTQAKLRALVEIGQSLGRAIELDEVLAKVINSLFSVFPQADRGFIAMKNPETGRLLPKAVKYRRGDESQTIRLSRTIINHVMGNREAVLSADAANDARFGMAESVVDFRIRSIMCAPLIGSDGNAMGVLQLDTLNPHTRFSGDDLEVLVSVASQAGRAVENAQLHEAAVRERAISRDLALAHQVQQGFLPSSAPTIAGYEFFNFYEPANKLGGDLFDYVELPGGRWAGVVADVAGKGIAASLLMAKLSAEARFCLASETTLAGAIGRLNRIFCDSNWEDRFVTMVIVEIDPQQNQLAVVNAGHLPALLRRRDGTIEAIGEAETGLPLGVDMEVEYVQRTLSFGEGEAITLYTDGITEAMNDVGDLFGITRLWRSLNAPAAGVGNLGRNLLADVKQFVGKTAQADDMCVMCIGRGGAS